MSLLPLLAVIAGFLIPFLFNAGPITNVSGLYLGVGCLAGLDSILGGVRSGLEGKFHNDVFITGFVTNVVIAFFFAWLGDEIGLDLFLVAVLVMGGRIYTNLSLIRRYILTRLKDAQDRLRLKEQQAQQAQSNG